MATGYDNRQPGRSSFAFTGPAPVQTRSGAQGAHRGAQIVGGRSTGGAAGAVEFTPAGPAAAGLGQFFEELMQPYVERRKNEAALKGAMDQMARRGGEEIKASNGAFSQIFGPSAYVEGAVLYSTQRDGKAFASETLANREELMQLPPDEAHRIVAERMQSKMTGNTFTDNLLASAMLENLAPVMETIAKSREVWQQTTARSNAAQASAAGADLYQSVGEANALLSDPTDADTITLEQAKQAFLGSLQKPHGMTDETYKDFIIGTQMAAMQKGNFHSVKALREAGIESILTDEERVKLEDAYHRYADAKISTALTQPGLMDEYLKLVADEADPPPGMKPADLVARKLKFNEAVKRVTGVDDDLFDHKAIASGVTGMVNALASERRRQEDHRWTVEAREADRAADAAEFDRRERLKVSKVTAAFIAGQSAKGLLRGFGERDDYEIQANNAYQSGNLGLLVSNFRGGMVFNGVRDDMQRQLEVAVGGQYGKSVEKAYQEWKVLNGAPGGPAAAMAYFGKYDGPMRAFHEMMLGKEVPPSIAFQRAFQDPSRYGAVAIPSGRSKEAKAGVDAAMSNVSAWTATRPLTGKPRNLNASSERAVRGYIENRLGNLMQNSTASAQRLATEILQNGVAIGAIERYGQFTIVNPPHTPNLSTLLNLQDDEATMVIVGLVDSKMKEAGYDNGASGKEYELVRYQDERGNPAITVLASDDSGHYSTVIRFSEMQAAARKRVQAGRAPNGRLYTGENPYRHIPGETGAQRIARINREVADGADPVKH